MVNICKLQCAPVRRPAVSFLLFLLFLCSLLAIAGPVQAQTRATEVSMSMQWAAVTDPEQWARMLQPLVESTEKILALANDLTSSVMKWMGQFAGTDQSVSEMLGQPFEDALKLLKALMQRIEQELIPVFKA